MYNFRDLNKRKITPERRLKFLLSFYKKAETKEIKEFMNGHITELDSVEEIKRYYSIQYKYYIEKYAD